MFLFFACHFEKLKFFFVYESINVSFLWWKFVFTESKNLYEQGNFISFKLKKILSAILEKLKNFLTILLYNYYYAQLLIIKLFVIEDFIFRNFFSLYLVLHLGKWKIFWGIRSWDFPFNIQFYSTQKIISNTKSIYFRINF